MNLKYKKKRTLEFLDFLVINVAQTRFKTVIYAQTQQPSFYVLLFIQYLS